MQSTLHLVEKWNPEPLLVNVSYIIQYDNISAITGHDLQYAFFTSKNGPPLLAMVCAMYIVQITNQ